VTADLLPGDSVRGHLRLLAPPNPLPSGFAVGEVVVYASHGIGRVESTRPEGVDPEAITLSFASGLTVILPLARAVEVLRPLSDETGLDDVKSRLRAEAPAPLEPWLRQHRQTREKVMSGRVAELAEVVRDGLRREQWEAVRGGGTTAPSDRELYLQAHMLLTAEIALCRGIEPADADGWILEQVGAHPAQT
jgi:RNA polymerase-interacting CarD/CdnL/TRCF family regulator